MTKTPDWSGDRYWGELVRFECPGLYGMPVNYTDGTKIPYTIHIPKISEVTALELVND